MNLTIKQQYGNKGKNMQTKAKHKKVFRKGKTRSPSGKASPPANIKSCKKISYFFLFSHKILTEIFPKPMSFIHLLNSLSLRDCKNLVRLPENLGNVESLELLEQFSPRLYYTKKKKKKKKACSMF